MAGPARGQPTKFNPERAARIVEALEDGCTRKASAEENGVDYRSLLNWFHKGERAKSGPYFQFFQDVTRAESAAENRYARGLRKAADGWDSLERTVTTRTVVERRKMTLGDGTVVDEPVTIELTTVSELTKREFDWRANVEWLKRRSREEWSEKTTTEVTGPGGGPVAIEYVNNWRTGGRDPDDEEDPTAGSAPGTADSPAAG